MDYLSYSSISTFIDCPERWFRRYRLGEKEPPKKVFVVGSAFHKTMEQNFTHKIEAGIDLSSRAIAQVYDTAFDDAAEDEGFELSELGNLKSEAWRLVEQYHREQAPTITPKSVEQRLEIPIPGKQYKKLIGYVDLITAKNIVVDYKATAWPWPDSQVNTSLQPTIYGLLLGWPELTFEYHLIIKSETIRQEKFGDGIVYKRTRRTQKDFLWLMSLIQKMLNIIEDPNVYDLIIPRPDKHCLTCPSHKTCGYRSRG